MPRCKYILVMLALSGWVMVLLIAMGREPAPAVSALDGTATRGHEMKLNRVYAHTASGVEEPGDDIEDLFAEPVPKARVQDIKNAVMTACRSRSGIENWAIDIGAHHGDLDRNALVNFTDCDWNILFVEASPSVFPFLNASGPEHHALNPAVKNGRRIEFFHGAIGAERATLPFYHVRAAANNTVYWATQVGSFNFGRARTAMRNANRRGAQGLELVKEDVQVYSPADLLQEMGIEGARVSVLLIDVEGHDGVVVQALPLKDMRPHIIVFERTHLKKPTFQQTTAYLRSHGYSVYTAGDDAFGVLGAA